MWTELLHPALLEFDLFFHQYLDLSFELAIIWNEFKN